MADMTPEQALDELRIYFDSLVDAPEATPESIREWGLSMLQALSRPAVPEVTDEMALAFHRAIGDGSLGQSDVDDIKAGLRRVFESFGAPAPAVPEGWKPVPVEATDEMCEALEECLRDHGFDHDGIGELSKAACWDALLAAAPEPAQPTFDTPESLASWLDSVTNGEWGEGVWPAAAVAAKAIRDADLCSACGSDVIYQDRVDAAKGVRHCDDCGHEMPAQEQPAQGDDHDPNAVSDHCPECGEPEPECVCGDLEQSDAVSDVLEELARATRKFPTWPTDPLHAIGVLNEEVGELSKAVLQAVYEPEKNPPNAVRKEALQAAAMCMRFIASLDAYEFTPGAQHAQGGR